MLRSLLRLVVLLLIGMLVPACSRGGGFEPDVVIAPQDYEVVDLTCTSRIAQAMVDGELVDEEQWWGRGQIANRLSESSPNYQLRYTAEFADGTTTDGAHAQVIFPLASGESQDFEFLVAPVGKAPTACEVQLYDSVLNYQG